MQNTTMIDPDFLQATDLSLALDASIGIPDPFGCPDGLDGRVVQEEVPVLVVPLVEAAPAAELGLAFDAHLERVNLFNSG